MTKKITASFLVAMLVVGCTTQQWFALMENLIPLAAQIAIQFYAYSNRGTIDAHDQAAIQQYSTDAQTILKTISDEVAAIKTAEGQGSTAQIKAALDELTAKSNVLLAALHVKDANTVSFVDALLADATDLINLLPQPIPVGPTASARTAVVRQMTKADAVSLQNLFKQRLDELPR